MRWELESGIENMENGLYVNVYSDVELRQPGLSATAGGGLLSFGSKIADVAVVVVGFDAFVA